MKRVVLQATQGEGSPTKRILGELKMLLPSATSVQYLEILSAVDDGGFYPDESKKLVAELKKENQARWNFELPYNSQLIITRK